MGEHTCPRSDVSSVRASTAPNLPAPKPSRGNSAPRATRCAMAAAAASSAMPSCPANPSSNSTNSSMTTSPPSIPATKPNTPPSAAWSSPAGAPAASRRSKPECGMKSSAARLNATSSRPMKSSLILPAGPFSRATKTPATSPTTANCASSSRLAIKIAQSNLLYVFLMSSYSRWCRAGFSLQPAFSRFPPQRRTIRHATPNLQQQPDACRSSGTIR